jgi:thymidine phosphorylase
MQTMQEAEILGRSIVDVANGAGVRTSALITDMNEPLAGCAGNAVEIVSAMAYLDGAQRHPRLHAVVMAFAADMLVNAGLATTLGDGLARAQDALDSGAALDCFGRMVHALGGPSDFAGNWKSHLTAAPVIRPILAPHDGFIATYATREIGLAVIGLGGGRLRPDDGVDHRTGFSAILPRGTRVEKGEPLAFVHAANENAAARGAAAYLECVTIGDQAPALSPVILGTIS